MYAKYNAVCVCVCVAENINNILFSKNKSLNRWFYLINVSDYISVSFEFTVRIIINKNIYPAEERFLHVYGYNWFLSKVCRFLFYLWISQRIQDHFTFPMNWISLNMSFILQIFNTTLHILIMPNLTYF